VSTFHIVGLGTDSEKSSLCVRQVDRFGGVVVFVAGCCCRRATGSFEAVVVGDDRFATTASCFVTAAVVAATPGFVDCRLAVAFRCAARRARAFGRARTCA
jgi:hypothetical protein